jgi:hypothetical protein
MSRPSFERAKAQFVHRYTMDHVPNWAKDKAPNGKYYAPQFRTDAEWYANTVFHGEPEHFGTRIECNTRNQSFPLGVWLNKPFRR